MALSINSTTYAGESAGMLINAAFLNATTLKMNGVKVMKGIKFRETIQNLNVGDVVDASTCDFPSTTFAVNTDEVTIEPKELQTTLDLCKQEFHNDWQSKFQFKSANDNVPGMFQNYMLKYIGGLIGSGIEQIVWQGDESLSSTNQLSRFNGFYTILDDAPATLSGTAQSRFLPADQKITGAAAAGTASGQYDITTAATVVGEFQTIRRAIPKNVYSQGPATLTHFTGVDVVATYVEALGAQANGINDQNQLWWAGGFSGLRHDGIPIFVATGQRDGTVITTYKENLIFGTSLMNDFNQVMVIDRSPIDGSRNARYVWRYQAATQVGNVKDCVLYAKAVKA